MRLIVECEMLYGPDKATIAALAKIGISPEFGTSEIHIVVDDSVSLQFIEYC